MSAVSPRSPRAILALFVALLAGTSMLVVLSPPAARAVTDAPIAVVIDRLTPVVPKVGDDLRIDGRIVNNTNDVITDVAVRLRIGSRPLTSRSEITLVREAPLDPQDPPPGADGTTPTPFPEPTNVVVDASATEVGDQLAPRAQVTFTVQVPLSDLPLPAPGVYAIGVEVLGALERGPGEDRQGMIRTFLPWFPEPLNPISLVWLWPLADWPAREANGVFLDDQTPRAVSVEGRLTTLVDSGASRPGSVSWIADPSLLQSVQDMTDGYQVVRGGEVAVGDRSSDAQAWLARLNAALQQAQSNTDVPALRVLPYADVDAVALTRAGMATDVVRSITQSVPVASSALGQPVSGGVYWAPFGRLDQETADLLASAGVRTVIVSGQSLRAQDAYAGANTGRTVIRTSFGALQAVLREPRMSALLTEPQQSRSDAIVVRQAFLAESGLLAGSIPQDAPSRAVVIGPDDIRWDPSPAVVNALLRATSNAPWVRPATLTELLAGQTNPLRREQGAYGSKALAAELPEEYLREVRATSRELAAFTSVLDNPIGVSDAYASALLRAQSSAWRSQPATGDALLATIDSQLTGQIDRVRVLSEGTVTFSGESGRVPVTIENSLDRSVTVGVQLRATPSLRLSSSPLTGITVEPGRKVSVDIEARVVGGNAIPVRVQLLTPDGSPFGSPATIEVASTAYARAAAWVVAIAFVAVVVFVVVGVARRIRMSTASRVPPSDGEHSP